MKTELYRDPVVEVYMPGVDRTLLRENLKLTYEERLKKHARANRLLDALLRSGKVTPPFAHKLKTTEDIFNYAAEQGMNEEVA